ncbi:IS3 family transposase, partial [Chlorobium phaeovibrioides]|nr:IS3 family transposase [Chlorobium phaeovibrioides]
MEDSNGRTRDIKKSTRRVLKVKSLIYSFINEHKNVFAVRTMCRVLDVTFSGYYAWTRRPKSSRTEENARIMTAIKDIHKESHETYGSPRIALDLGKRGIKCSRPRVARLMREMGIRARCARKFKVTTDSNHKEPIAPNFLDQDFYPDMPFEVWTSDLTYLWTDSGWQYLTVVMELFNREIIGYSLSRSMSTETTVIPAFEMAVLHRQPPEGVLFHSDRGVQYASKSFRKKLSEYRMIQSMSGKGNCYDNAATESFFKTLKSEWIYGRRIRSKEELQKLLFEYIHVFYNR